MGAKIYSALNLKMENKMNGFDSIKMIANVRSKIQIALYSNEYAKMVLFVNAMLDDETRLNNLLNRVEHYGLGFINKLELYDIFNDIFPNDLNDIIIVYLLDEIIEIQIF